LRDFGSYWINASLRLRLPRIQLLPTQREGRPIGGGQSLTADEAYFYLSSPLFKTFRAWSLCCPPYICATFALSHRVPAGYFLSAPYQRVFGGILHFIGSSLHGFATHGILCQTILKAITRDPRLGSQQFFLGQTDSYRHRVETRYVKASKCTAAFDRVAPLSILNKKIPNEKEEARPVPSEPLLVWPKSSEHRAPKIGRAV
jgi:hypothetical protein